MQDRQFPATHHQLFAETGHYQVRGGVAALAVTVAHPAQLPAAVSQREKPVVIENTPANKNLIRVFNIYIRVDHWWVIGALVAYAIYQGFSIQLSHTEWRAGKTTEDKIILTPPGH